MGKKYDAYAKAARAENQARTRLEAEKVGGDKSAIQQAATDFKQTNEIAKVTYDEWSKDITG